MIYNHQQPMLLLCIFTSETLSIPHLATSIQCVVGTVPCWNLYQYTKLLQNFYSNVFIRLSSFKLDFRYKFLHTLSYYDLATLQLNSETKSNMIAVFTE